MTLPPLPEPFLYEDDRDKDGNTVYSRAYTDEQMQAYATAAVLAEREACAKLCADRFVGDDEAKDDECRACADVIRERSAV